MITDTHVHVFPPDVIRDWEKIARKEAHFASLVRGKVHRWATVEDVVDSMNLTGIDESWIFGFAFEDQGLCRLCNDYVIDALKQHPDGLRGLAVVSPGCAGCEAELVRCRNAGMIGVGELFPQGQGVDITDPRQTWRLASLTHEAGMFLLIHTAEPVGHDYPGKGNVGPKEAAMFCINHPEVSVVFAHFGGGLWQYELMPEMKRILSNAWYDTAEFPWLYSPEVLLAIECAGVSEKFLYGSDFPILTYQRYSTLWEQAGLRGERLEKILSGNAETLLRNTPNREGTPPCSGLKR